jgi:hypothetical protein
MKPKAGSSIMIFSCRHNERTATRALCDFQLAELVELKRPTQMQLLQGDDE